MRSAARSNWLATMAFPDIEVRGVAGAVTRYAFGGKREKLAECSHPSGWERRVASSLADEAAAGEAGRRVLRFRQGVGDVDAPCPASPGVGEHADHVRRARRRGGVIDGVLEHEHQPGA